MKQIGKKLLQLLTVLVLIVCMAPGLSAGADNLVIVLDPGHGGTETGATRTFSGITYREEKLNQKIAEYCKAELETYAGVTVYLTRNSVSQASQDRETRINYAKKKNADALVSIHINSTSAKKQTTSTGAYCCVPSTKFKTASAKEARALATSILKSLKSQVGLENNGYWIDDELGIILFGQKSDYTTAEAKELGISKSVLNQKIPSLIVEHCFVNNPNDCKNYLKTTAQLKKLGVADAAGIASYYGLKKKTESSSTETETETKTGVVTVGSDLYLYDAAGKIMTGLVKYSGKYYYADSTGKLTLGWKTIDGKRYYFDKTTGAAITGWKTIDGKRYYFDKTTGAAVTGWKTISSKKYYFDKSTGAALTGLQKIGKYKYYFSSKGVMQKKWVKINGKRYYFSKVNGRLLTRYWLKYNGKWYRLDKNGTPLVSCKRKINGKVYWFDSKGVCTNK